jgi:M6 family metalloprotease-like protein
MKSKARNLATTLSLLLIASTFNLVPTLSSAAQIKAGAVCKKSGVIRSVGAKEFICKKSGKKLLWTQVVKAKPVAPTPSPSATPTPSVSPSPSATPTQSVSPTPTSTPTPTPTPTVKTLTIYTGGRGAAEGSSIAKSVELNFTPQSAPTATNLKLWIHDPENNSKSANSPGLYYRKSDGDWILARTNSDGTIYLSLSAGTYTLDTIEPNNNTTKYKRKAYSATIDSAGKASITQLGANSQGFFTITLDLVVASPTFQPANLCQLRGPVGSSSVTNGFPRVPGRLPSSGEIRALIIPVDFPDVIGRGDPAEIYYEMATEMDAYFRKVSDNRVSFTYQVLPRYLRMEFFSAAYNLGSWNNGDSFGYWKATLAAADPFVDYSKFDVVYVLSPKTIPSTSIAYGPAFPTKVVVEDGFVMNGTISGADAYMSFPGASWKWMAHETGHLFGLHDLYTVPPQEETFGEWDLMSLNWTTRAIELNAWNRYLTGWLAESQIDCLDSVAISSSAITRNLVPLVEKVSGQKAQFVKLSDTKILVMEYRTTGGYDVIPEQEEGVLIYTVDTTIQSIKGGWQVQRRPGSTKSNFSDAALRTGDKITVSGITIEVTSLAKTSASLKISKG